MKQQKQGIIERHDLFPSQSKTFYALIKESKQIECPIYGGKMSARHYFCDFVHCENGMIPWLLVAEVESKSGWLLVDWLEYRFAVFHGDALSLEEKVGVSVVFC